MDFRFFFPSKKSLDKAKGSVNFEILKSRFLDARESTKSLNTGTGTSGFYIQTRGYAEQVCKGKLEVLNDIYKHLTENLNNHVLSSRALGLTNRADLDRHLYDLISSCLGTYEDIVKWRNEIAHQHYALTYASLFSSLYQVPAQFIGAFEEFCLNLPDSADECVNRCMKSMASGKLAMKAIPFAEQPAINVDCNSAIYPIWATINSCTAPPGNARGDETGTKGRDASSEGPRDNKLALNYFPPSALNDRQCRLIYKAKRPGWESVLFALEVRNRVQGVIKESSRYSGQDESTSIYIGTTANAIRICKSHLAWLENITKRLVGIAKVNITLQDGGTYEEVIHAINQAAQGFLRPYIELKTWMKDVSCLRYHPRFHFLFFPLRTAPIEFIDNLERYYIGLYDHFTQHANGEWHVQIEEINLESIHEELLRLSRHHGYEGSLDKSTQPTAVSNPDPSPHTPLQPDIFESENVPIEADSEEYSLGTNSDPVTVGRSDGIAQTFTIPRPEPKKEKGLQLDFAKISVIEAESHRVTSMLNTIFDEAAESSATPPPAISAVETLDSAGCWGLDSEFSAFLRLLGSRPAWSRAELEELAADRSLMLDGVLEHINEAALDRFDQPFTEGDDPLEINQELIKEISS